MIIRPKEKVSEEEELVVISDKIKFMLKKDLALQWYNEGKKLILSDIIKLIIDKIPKEVFDKLVKEIFDVVEIYALRELASSIYEKSKDVVSIKFYDKEPPVTTKNGIQLITVSPLIASIPSLVSGIVEAISSIISKVIGNSLAVIRKNYIMKKN